MNLFSRQAAPKSTELLIEGMVCSACQSHVESALRGVAGVTSASVDLKNNRASVSGDAPQSALLEAVEEAGYSASVA